MFKRLAMQFVASVLVVAVPLSACTTQTESAPTPVVALETLEGFEATAYDESGNLVNLSGGAGWADLRVDGTTYAVDLSDLAAYGEPELTDLPGAGVLVDYGDGYTMRSVDAWLNANGTTTIMFEDSNGSRGAVTVVTPEEEPAPDPTPDPGPGPGPVEELPGTELDPTHDSQELPAGVSARADGKTWADIVDDVIKNQRVRASIKAILRPFGWILRRIPAVLLTIIIGSIAACLARGGVPTVKVKLLPPDLEIGCAFPPAPNPAPGK